MNTIDNCLAALGVGIPEILLPRDGIDLSKWAVIACDQFTQDREYWERVKNIAAGAPSCINLIFPEVYLEGASDELRGKRILDIRDSMNAYSKGNVFAPPRRCCVYLERSTPHNPKRRGLVLLVDLERYEWAPQSRPLIRSTEGTVTERLPSRIQIRRGAPLELPHILLLIDDEQDELIPALGKIARTRPPLYETPLMMNSGAVSGWAVDTRDAWTLLADGLQTLAEKSGGESPFLFAVGDGNHSLASAKAVWEEYKKSHAGDAALENHPARWALVEVENLYDPGISFQPIHRIVFGESGGAWRRELVQALAALPDIQCHVDDVGAAADGSGGNLVIRIESRLPDIATASIQPLLDRFVSENGFSIDYIHGEEETVRLASDPARAAAGIILPPVRKDGFFKTIAQNGPLPRKSFSMGEAEEKRFYLECRALFGELAVG